LKRANVSADGFEAIFYPGGHGSLWDQTEYADSKRLIEVFATTDRPISAVRQAPAVFHRTVGADGKPQVAGRRGNGFTNTEERPA
jgi:putative intracellular protease/amidase